MEKFNNALMYERLTKRFLGSNAPYTEFDYNKIINRLCEMEDKICEGRMLELPCKVDSEVWFSDKENNSVWDGRLLSFSLDASHLWFNCHYKCGLNIWHPIEDFGKTVFLTKAEANKKLKELENEQR